MKRLTLIHQNDTHAHIARTGSCAGAGGQPEVWCGGGYAHLRAIADRIRREVGNILRWNGCQMSRFNGGRSALDTWDA